jgi:pimeloyl-ACP methyl ester carboxylesterase
VVDFEGQRVGAADRLYLAEGLPVLIVWGARDPVIPVQHAESAHEATPGSRLEIFEGTGHLPQVEAPEHFVTVLERFMHDTQAPPFDPEQWRARLRSHDPDG